MQEKVNALNDRFLSIVSEGRKGKLSAGKEEWGTGKMFFGQKALDLGLIDGILSYEETLQTIFENLI
jgi:ClpP class serine protease